MSTARRFNMFFAWLRQSAKQFRVYFPDLPWCLRVEDGELTGRRHFHFLVAGFPAHGKACKKEREMRFTSSFAPTKPSLVLLSAHSTETSYPFLRAAGMLAGHTCISAFWAMILGPIVPSCADLISRGAI
jgi:hypothetical protein